METTRAWAGLADFPGSAKNVRVTTQGSMFTREFYVEFDAPLADIDAWIMASPGPATATVSRIGTRRHYVITPGGGAQFAAHDNYRENGARADSRLLELRARQAAGMLLTRNLVGHAGW